MTYAQTTPLALWAILVAASLGAGACASRPPAGAPEVQPEAPAQAQSAARPARSGSIDGDLMYRLLVAEFAGRRGQLDLALGNYLTAARESDDPRVAERATRIAVFARDNERALVAARRWAELDPGNLEVHQVLATLYIRLDDVERAVGALGQVVELSAEGPEHGIGVVAALLGREKDNRVAFEVMTRLSAQYPDFAIAHYSRGLLAERAGEHEQALTAFDRAIALRADYDDALVARGKVLIDLGRTDEAFGELSAAVGARPENLPLRLGYARLLVEAGQYDKAAPQLRELYTRSRQNANLVYALGLLAIESRRLDDAREYMQQVLDLGARGDDANYYLGRIAESRRDYEQAIGHYQRVGGGDNELDAQIRIAEVMARLGRLDEARAHLNRLQTVNPEPGHAIRFYLAEGEVLRQAGRFDEALEVLSAALDQHPDNVDLLYARALTAEKLDRSDIFEADLRLVLSREPDNAHALNALGYFLADRTERLDEAERYIGRALELLPSDAAVIDSMGWLHYRRGDHDKALEYLRKAYQKLEDPEIAAHLGEVLWVTGDREGAAKVWNRALEVAPEDRVLRRVMQRFQQ